MIYEPIQNYFQLQKYGNLLSAKSIDLQLQLVRTLEHPPPPRPPTIAFSF